MNFLPSFYICGGEDDGNNDNVDVFSLVWIVTGLKYNK